MSWNIYRHSRWQLKKLPQQFRQTFRQVRHLSSQTTVSTELSHWSVNESKNQTLFSKLALRSTLTTTFALE